MCFCVVAPRMPCHCYHPKVWQTTARFLHVLSFAGEVSLFWNESDSMKHRGIRPFYLHKACKWTWCGVGWALTRKNMRESKFISIKELGLGLAWKSLQVSVSIEIAIVVDTQTLKNPDLSVPVVWTALWHREKWWNMCCPWQQPCIAPATGFPWEN